MSSPRIAYLLKKFPRLSETFVLNEILSLERLGVDVQVVARRPVDDEPRHPQFAQLGAPIEQLPRESLDPFQELFASPNSQDLSLDRFGEVVREVQGFRHGRMPKLFSEALWLRRHLQETGVDHVHVHFATDSAIVAMLVHELGGPSYSLTAHAKDIYRSTVEPALLSRIIEHSAFTVTVCDANVEHLNSILSPAAKAKVRRLYNGIDQSQFAPPSTPRVADHVLAVGRLVPKKGFNDLIDALQHLRVSRPQLRATLVGVGDEEQALRTQAQAAGIGTMLEFAGAQDQGVVRDLMRSATLFCLPCVIGDDGNRDALPTVLLEALACGLPMISTDVTGIPEILDGGKAGVLVPQHDPVALANAMDSLLADPARREQLAGHGLTHVAEHFDGAKQAKVLAGWLAEAAAVEVV